MKVWHVGALWILLAAACSFESGGAGVGPEIAETSDTTSTTTAMGTDESGHATGSSTTPIADGTGGGSSAAGTGFGSTTASGTAGSSCGNGVLEGDEVCDDGDEDEFDCTAQCTIPACDDRQHNGDETDVDCGAACPECSLCQGCVSDSDCRHNMVCGTDGRCVPQLEMTVDWVGDCGSAVNGAALVGLDAGTYRATALHSAGTLWEQPHNPPNSGYFYEMMCTGVSFEQMRTPPGQRYVDVDASFSAMISETETFEFAGGDLTCWVEDATCGDNDGSTEFSLEYVCGR